MKTAIIGLDQSGKTTVFNILTNSSIDVNSFSSKETVNLGNSIVPDKRMDILDKHFQPKKKSNAVLELADFNQILKKGKSASLSPKFIENMKKMELICFVIRIFKDDNIIHPENSIDPVRDINLLTSELILADLGIIENRIHRIEQESKSKKKNDTTFKKELEVLNKIKIELENEKMIFEMDLTDEEIETINHFKFLTMKNMLFIGNIDEEQLLEKDKYLTDFEEYCKKRNFNYVTFCAKIEMELLELDEEEKIEFMKELNIKEPAKNIVLRAIYDNLGLISFFTVGKDEVKAWTIKKDLKALYAAGKIHSDIQKGFIRAQVVSYDDFVENDFNFSKCKDNGKLRLEGKEYLVQDGDIIEFRFNV